jgi:hypothetical protein
MKARILRLDMPGRPVWLNARSNEKNMDHEVRKGQGSGQGLVSHYRAFSFFFWVAILPFFLFFLHAVISEAFSISLTFPSASDL